MTRYIFDKHPWAILLMTISLFSGFAAYADDIRVQREKLVIEVEGHNISLDILIGIPGDQEGEKYPVALISHGAAGRDSPRDITTDSLSAWVRSFATRGYLAVAVMRPGYDTSEGEDYTGNDSCENPAAGAYLEHHAADLAAALHAIAQRPDADMETIVAIGHSAGGGSMLALAARNEPKLAAVINVAGGTFWYKPGESLPANVFSGCEKGGVSVSEALEDFARKTDVPTLWLYARNDRFFTPDIVTPWITAWREAGGHGKLIFLDPYETDGHAMFIETDGQERLLPHIDRFLRSNALPTWNDSDFTTLRETLGPKQQEDLDMFLTSGISMKVMAIPITGDTNTYWNGNYRSVEAARLEVLARCRESSGSDCIIVAENNHPTGALPMNKPRSDE